MFNLLQTEAEVTALILQTEADFAVLEVNKKCLTCQLSRFGLDVTEKKINVVLSACQLDRVTLLF